MTTTSRPGRAPRVLGGALSILVLLAGGVVTAAGADASSTDVSSTVYVTNSFSASVSAVDTATNTVIKTIKVGQGPTNPVFSPDGKQLYVPNSLESSISVIDTATNQVSRTISTAALTTAPHPVGMAFEPNGRSVFMTFLSSDLLAPGEARIFTPATGEFGAPIKVGQRPEQVAMAPDGKHAYTADVLPASMSVVDLDHFSVVAHVSVGLLPMAPIVSADSSKVYVGTSAGDSITVVDARTNKVTSTIKTDLGPTGLMFSRDNKYLYSANVFANSLQEIDVATGKVLRRTDIGFVPGYLDVTNDGRFAYVARVLGTQLAVVDLATLKVVKDIDVGLWPSVPVIYHGA